jgi:hypothetical protein
MSFTEQLQVIADNRGVSVGEVRHRYDIYSLRYMMGEFITPPNLGDFQKYYL